MSKLTKMQITYAIERLQAALETKLDAWVATLPTLPDRPVVLTPRRAKWQAIYDGTMVFPADFVKSIGDSYALDADKLPLPSGTDKKIEKSKAEYKAWNQKAEARHAVICAHRALLEKDLATVKDALYLSDSAAALAAVTAYCS